MSANFIKIESEPFLHADPQDVLRLRMKDLGPPGFDAMIASAVPGISERMSAASTHSST